MTRFFWVLFEIICVNLRPAGPAFAAPAPAPTVASSPSIIDEKLTEAGKVLEASKAEVQRLKDSWDKTRLETTLYQQRATRAYKRWIKSAKKLRDAAKVQKDRADLELQLSVEKRKLAWGEWQIAQFRLASEEAKAQALDQEKDTAATRERIRQLTEKLTPEIPLRSSQPAH